VTRVQEWKSGRNGWPTGRGRLGRANELHGYESAAGGATLDGRVAAFSGRQVRIAHARMCMSKQQSVPSAVRVKRQSVGR